MEKWTIDVICGSIGGILGTLIGHPLDTMKCRFQSLSYNSNSLVKAFLKILKEEKFFGFFKGVGAPLLNQLPNNSIEYYRMHGVLSRKFPKNQKVANYFLSGSWSGFVGLIFMTPAELVKCIQQTETKAKLGSSEILREIIRTNGFFGIFRGFSATFNRDLLGIGLYFSIYYSLRDYGEDHNLTSSSLYLLMIGGIAGLISWVVVFPFDTIKTNIQIQIRYQIKLTQGEAIKMIMKKSGVSGFFNGLQACSLRAFLVNAVIFYSNEIMHSLLEPKFIKCY